MQKGTYMSGLTVLLLVMVLVSCTNEPQLEPVVPPQPTVVEPSEETVQLSDEARIAAVAIGAASLYQAYPSSCYDSEGYLNLYIGDGIHVSKDESLGITDDVSLRFKWGRIRARYRIGTYGARHLENLEFELDAMFNEDARIYIIKFECSPIEYGNAIVAYDCHATINERPYDLTIPSNKLI